MKKLYQIIILGSLDELSNLKASLEDYPEIVFRRYQNINNQYPYLFLYFGLSSLNKKYKGDINLNKLVLEGAIIPVIPSQNYFHQFVPEELSAINAFVLSSSNNIAALKNRILEFFDLIDGTYKVFISYKRSDSSSLALRIYDTLVRNHYNPFLDCFSIAPGVDFQRYLISELADSDIFVYINSPHYSESKNTMLEIDCASKMNIGIIEVTIDGSKGNRAVFNANRLIINKLIPEHLDEDAVKILNVINDSRAKMLKFRRKSIIDSFMIQHRQNEIAIIDDNVIADFSNGMIYRVYNHIPTSSDLQHTSCYLDNYNKKGFSKVLLYDSQYYRNSLTDHLKWLNAFLDIKSQSVNE